MNDGIIPQPGCCSAPGRSRPRPPVVSLNRCPSSQADSPAAPPADHLVHPDHPVHQPVRVVTPPEFVIRMIRDTACMTVKTTVESQFSATVSEGDL